MEIIWIIIIVILLYIAIQLKKINGSLNIKIHNIWVDITNIRNNVEESKYRTSDIESYIRTYLSNKS